ncbi:hypothetical protein [Haladaptatus cibarius]|uniref:hypothetical protein n=1 Tax=Haladaptatus cibarius TaxID=453847 RepID=UPI000B017324|nr:hypothetical protein [Haladaptatus cibarius]
MTASTPASISAPTSATAIAIAIAIETETEIEIAGGECAALAPPQVTSRSCSRFQKDEFSPRNRLVEFGLGGQATICPPCGCGGGYSGGISSRHGKTSTVVARRPTPVT